MKKPCWCYTGEIQVCCECDREYVTIDVRTYLKLNPKVRKILNAVKSREKAQRLDPADLERRSSKEVPMT